ncbi:LOW QUALITY PROTEIN: transcriptional regulator, partial [Streptomyces sviceus ATCC 29083]
GQQRGGRGGHGPRSSRRGQAGVRGGAAPRPRGGGVRRDAVPRRPARRGRLPHRGPLHRADHPGRGERHRGPVRRSGDPGVRQADAGAHRVGGQGHRPSERVGRLGSRRDRSGTHATPVHGDAELDRRDGDGRRVGPRARAAPTRGHRPRGDREALFRRGRGDARGQRGGPALRPRRRPAGGPAARRRRAVARWRPASPSRARRGGARPGRCPYRPGTRALRGGTHPGHGPHPGRGPRRARRGGAGPARHEHL